MTQQIRIAETIHATGGSSITFGHEPVQRLEAVRFRQSSGEYTTRFGVSLDDLESRITRYAILKGVGA